MRRHRLSFVVALFACAPLALVAESAAQQASRPSSVEQCPDQRSWTGKYKNYDFGFSIVIPAALKGFWNSAACASGPDGCTCMPDHGRIIPLGGEPYEPGRHMEAYAGYAAHLDKPTLAGLVDSHLQGVREWQGTEKMDVRERSKIALAGLHGERVVVRYYNIKLKRWMMEDFIEILRWGDVEYSLYLRTREDAYIQDRAIFDAMVATFTPTKRVR